MNENKFYLLLNKVFTLMIKNKLREDIDDTLLEKLLSIIKSNITNDCFISDLLKNTNALVLCEKALSDFKEKGKKELSTPITAFALRLLGLVFGNQNIFVSRKNTSLCNSLSHTICSNAFVTESPSIQDALLTILLSMANHQEGTMWMIELKMIDFIFTGFSSTSYYVRKTAVKFFSTTLQLWTNPEFYTTLHLSQKTVLEETIKNIMSRLITLISTTQFPKDTHADVRNSCISILKQIYENNVNVLNDSFQLLEVIIKYFENLNKTDVINQEIVDLLLIILQRDHSHLPVIRKIVQLLVARKMFSAAFHLVSASLSNFEDYKPVSSNRLLFLMMPLDVAAGKNLLTSEESIFCSSTEAVYTSLIKEMDAKSTAVLLISSSLRALTKLTSFMNAEAIKTLLSSLTFVFKPFPSAEQFLPFSCLENKTLCLSLLELFASFLRKEVYVTMDFQNQQILFEYLIQFLQKTSIDSNIVSEVLCLLKYSVALNTQHNIAFGNADEVIKLLCRKLFDSKESIVDSALHLAGEIMNGKDRDLWSQVVLKDSVHIIVWDIAIEGCHDGAIKASALKVITEACLQSCYLNDIKSVKSINEVDIMNVLCNYVQDPDFFMGREAVLCACKWIHVKEKLLPSSCKDKLFLILSTIVRSLDLELKLIALDQWIQCLENNSFFPEISSASLNSCLAMYCNSGFGASLMYALEDYDEAVKYRAAKIMWDLREKFIQLGFNKDLVPLNETQAERNQKSESQCESVAISISKEEQEEGIESVLKISTAQQLLDICKMPDLPEYYSYTNCAFPALEMKSSSCSIMSFWDCIWSTKLDSLLSTDEVPTTIFSDYSLSLLDDIIAAERTVYSMDDTMDCY